jgi:hypothetical protein
MASGEKFHVALLWLFGGSKWPFYVTRGAGTTSFFVHHFLPLLPRLPGSFWTNFGWLYRQGGRLNFNRMLCFCRQRAPTKTLVS